MRGRGHRAAAVEQRQDESGACQRLVWQAADGGFGGVHGGRLRLRPRAGGGDGRAGRPRISRCGRLRTGRRRLIRGQVAYRHRRGGTP